MRAAPSRLSIFCAPTVAAEACADIEQCLTRRFVNHSCRWAACRRLGPHPHAQCLTDAALRSPNLVCQNVICPGQNGVNYTIAVRGRGSACVVGPPPATEPACVQLFAATAIPPLEELTYSASACTRWAAPPGLC